MRSRKNVLLLSVAMVAGVAAAQSASPANATRGNSAVEEHLFGADRQRMQWEAAQTYFLPEIPYREQLKVKPIYIEGQAPPTVPKLRREWLQPRTEILNRDSTAETAPAPGRESAGFLLPKLEKGKQ